MHSFNSLRYRLLALALLVALPAFFLIVYTSNEERRHATEDVQAAALTTLRDLANEQTRLTIETRTLLTTLSRVPLLRPGQIEACHDLLQSVMLSSNAHYSLIGIVDLEGNIVCSVPETSASVNLSEREYVREAMENNTFTVGEYQIGEVSSLPIIPFAMPIPGADEQPIGLVVAGLALQWLGESEHHALLPPGSSVTILDSAGTILTRYPDPERWIGQGTPEDSTLFSTIQRAQGRGVGEAAGVDGVTRLYAFQPLPGLSDDRPVYISVGIPSEIAYARVDQIRARNLISLAAMTVLMLTLAWLGGDLFVRKRALALLQATRRLAAGDLSTRVASGRTFASNDELGELARSFDQMAASLESQADERQLAEARTRAVEDLYRRAIAAAGAVPYQKDDRRWAFTFMGENIYELTGYTAEEMTPDLWDRISDNNTLRGPLSGMPMDEAIFRVQSGEFDTWTADHYIQTRSGEYRWIADTSVELRDASGLSIGSIGLLQDITERKLAEEQLRRQAERLQQLAAASHLFAQQTEDFYAVLQTVTCQAAEWLGDSCAMRLLSDDKSYYRHGVVYDVDPEFNALAQEILHPGTGQQISDFVRESNLLTTGEPVLVPVMQDVPGFREQTHPLWRSMKAIGSHSMLVVAMRSAGQTVGLLFLSRRRSELPSFDEEDVAQAQDIADRAVLAIRNARLYADARTRLERLQALHTIDKAILAEQELPATLEVVVQQIVEQARVDAVAVLLYDAESEKLVYAAGTGFRTDAIQYTSKSLGEGNAGLAARDRRIQVVEDLATAEHYMRRDLLAAEGFHSYYGVPLIVHEEVLGVLDIFHRSPLPVDAELLSFLEALALQTSIAIDHARLFSETRRLLESTQQQAQELQQIVEAVPEGVLVLGRNGQIALANPTARAYLDMLVESGEGSDTRLTHLGGKAIDEFLAEAAATQGWLDVNVEQPFRIFEAVARPIGAENNPLAWVLVLRDVTQERSRRAKEQVQERLATVGQLAAGIAHDFNNILTPIVIYTELTRRSLPKEAEASTRHLGEVLKATARAKELITQILTFSRQRDSGEHKPIALQPIIREAMRLLRAGLPATIEIREQIDARAGPVLANATQIHQVLMNLCTNAQYAMREQGGTLTVTLDTMFVDEALAAAHADLPANLHVGPHLRLCVRDTGHGMEEDTLHHIFEPFYTTKSRGEGTGMGLAVVHGIVHAHGGEIVAESAPGEGSMFTIYLPQYIQEADNIEADEETETDDMSNGMSADGVGMGEMRARSAMRESGAQNGEKRILIVDDEKDIALATQDILEGFGYQVTAVFSSLDALEAFRDAPEGFALLITDLTMPQMTGAALAKEVLALSPGLPVIMISGYAEASVAEQVEAIRPSAFLHKPFTIADLAQTVKRVLDEDKR